MSIVHHSLREKICRADSTQHQASVATALHIWELYVGTVQLFVVGPGTEAWLACSKPCYSGQVGTDGERATARRAVAILNREQRENKDAGTLEIKAALQQAADAKTL